MTQDEVDTIYAYLHENYEYRDGELVSKISKGRSRIQDCIGSFFMDTGNPNLHTSFTISGITHRMPLSHAVYIYHKKIKPRYINYLDGNITNTRIENLECASMKSISKSHIGKGYQKCGNKFRARIIIDGKSVNIGRFNTEEEAHEAYLKAKHKAAGIPTHGANSNILITNTFMDFIDFDPPEY